ncbi:transcription-repair coupling factor [Candidatus Sororendozoicomonas aggregata]|uniref:transcription-repair coupling factor n=1 Tax=Candidatus Sororendozoicomonas aggregata TaxID=3073239 RepID=UPI002ED4F4C9
MAQGSLTLPPHAGNKITWGQLSGTQSAYLIHQVAQQHNGLLLVITSDSASALKLEEELRFFLGNSSAVTLHQLPDWETLPYDNFSPHQDIVSERLATLYQLPRAQRAVLVTPITTLIHQICPRSFLESGALVVTKGEGFLLHEHRHTLEQAGYRCVESVFEHGEFAIRGSMMDIFPMGSTTPFRIDLFDDDIDSIRTFDPETQRSIEEVDSIHLLPGHEFPMDKASRDRFRANYRDYFDVDHRDCPLYQDIGVGVASPGIEYYLPLFFEQTATLFDYLPEKTTLVLGTAVPEALERFHSDAQERYENRKVDPLRPLLPPEKLFLKPDAFYAQAKAYARIQLSTEAVRKKPGQLNYKWPTVPELTLNAKLDNPLAPLLAYLSSAQRVLLVAESPGRREVLLELLKDANILPTSFDDWSSFVKSESTLAITIGILHQAVEIPEAGISLIPENCLLGQHITQSRRRKNTNYQADQFIRNLTELRIGAPVVHIDHGVGRYQGLKTLGIEGQMEEFLTLEYANDARLYVPVAALHLITRYSGADDETAPLHRLGNEQWSKARKKAAEKAHDVAAELLDIYARREARKGFAFDAPDQQYLTFSASFPFEETPDQQSTIRAVIDDMCAPSPMDRLVCGDVGFGKTEVAMRAAFLAVQSGKQVAILVPTTLLAQQHFESFRDRFADWPVNVEVMSRFRSAKAIQSLQQKIEQGATDILIGTHKILQNNMPFKDLGLLIIDEEHRFGVRHKEKLKSLRTRVDILTLTATPIPRTLNMAMSGIRDLSIIATPPERRLSVKTFIREKDPHLVREAILRELLRGGQVYYLHNEVQTIEKTAQDLSELLPEARIAIGHGQMRERELEQVMSEFYHKRCNVLVCTTIVETGIDVPSANTIIIHRADKFGLAQLHQLRGRVGRSHHQAYAYLLTPPAKTLTPNATKRLEAIGEAQDLGAGFMLASHDLEIRGAGELLGEGQSGQIQHVGFTLYTEMLEQAVESIKKGETPNTDKPLAQSIDINLRIPALLPEDYIHDVHARLILYKRIAAATTEGELKNLQVELIDRFGLLPEPAKYLFRQTSLKLKAQTIGIQKLDAGPERGKIEFESQPRVDPMIIIRLIQSEPETFQLDGSNVLKYCGAMTSPDQRFNTIERLLKTLGA